MSELTPTDKHPQVQHFDALIELAGALLLNAASILTQAQAAATELIDEDGGPVRLGSLIKEVEELSAAIEIEAGEYLHKSQMK